MRTWVAALIGAAVGAGAVALALRTGTPGAERGAPDASPAAERTAAPPAGPTDPPSARDGAPTMEVAPVTPQRAAPDLAKAPPPAAADAPRPAAQPPVVADPCPEAEEARQEAKALRDKVEELEHKLARIDPRTYDLSQETLLRLAARCELRWDMQPPRIDGPAGISRDAAEKAGLGEREQGEVGELMKAYNDRMLAAVRGLYVEVTGDAETANLAPEAMLAEIDDKTDPAELKRVFQQLAAERAGLAAAPTDLTQAPAVERLYRLLTSAGDDLEGELASHIGSEKARALRDHEGGWNSRSRSSHGCPGQD